MNNTNFRLTMQLGTMDITIWKSQQSKIKAINIYNIHGNLLVRNLSC